MNLIGNDPYIRLSRKVIKEMFDRCNQLYFNGRVEEPWRIETWTPDRRTLGMVRPAWSAKRQAYRSILHISRRYRWRESTLRQVVVHEMIHLAIYDYQRPLNLLQRLPLIGRWFIVGHDREFIDMMNDLNARYDLGIQMRFPQMKAEFIR